jgi:hypothetical protein
MLQDRSIDRLVRLINSTDDCDLESIITSSKTQLPFPLCCVLRVVLLDTKRLLKQEQHEFISLWLSPSPCNLTQFYKKKSSMFSYPFYAKFVVNKSEISECDWRMVFGEVKLSISLLSVKFP